MNKDLILFFSLTLALFGGLYYTALADTQSQTLSVSPTLIEMQAVQQQSWTSDLRVINVNTYDIEVYPQVQNFEATGEDGRGNFIPVNAADATGATLAEWITLPSEPILIKSQQTATIPVHIHVPEHAAPGGHYAAILVGTKPPKNDAALDSQVQTSQFVSSLIFVSVAGDVKEEGTIREFRTTADILQTPDVTMEMRFENKGNVHLQPQGEIKIYNMWGQERGVVPINQLTHFGNVLPGSIRKFTFTWKGETAFYDIGRYSAIATLGYGQSAKQFATSTTYFWVIPYTTLGSIFLILLILYKIISFLIRRYVTHMIELSGVVVPNQTPDHTYHYKRRKSDSTVIVGHYKHVAAPVTKGVRELKMSWKTPLSIRAKVVSLGHFVFQYKLFFAACLFIGFVVWGGVVIWHTVTAKTAHYAVGIKDADTTISLSQEEVAYNKLREATPVASSTKHDKPTIAVINVSGYTGTAAEVRLQLEQAGYTVTSLTADVSRKDRGTVIVYPVNHQNSALSLSKMMPGALLSALDTNKVSDEITIYVGSDRIGIPKQ